MVAIHSPSTAPVTAYVAPSLSAENSGVTVAGSSIRTNTRNKDQRYYKLSLKLVDTERNTIVWIANEEIRKLTTKGWMQ